jgi:GT2 family glycosyltransferase
MATESEMLSQVDVVVPCYNYGKYLDQCVASILAQQGVQVRILIIDDASSDHTAEVGRRLAALDRRVEFVRHDVNQGHLATYHEGLLHWASAAYSLLISADDALASGALERATTIMDCHTEVGMVYGKVRVILDDDDPAEFRESFSAEDYTIWPGERFLKSCLEVGANPVPHMAVVRTAIQRQLGGYRIEFPHGGDFEMWMRFAAHGAVAYVPTVQTYYRRHISNMSHAYPPLVELPERIKILNHVAASVDSRFPEATSWLRTGFRRLGDHVYCCAENAFDRGKMEEVRASLDVANEISCRPYRYRRWWRLQIRQLIGQALWSKMRPALARLLGKSVIPRGPHWAPQRGQIHG